MEKNICYLLDDATEFVLLKKFSKNKSLKFETKYLSIQSLLCNETFVNKQKIE